MEAAGGQALVHPADITDSGHVEAMTAAAVARFGRVDALIANAGLGSPGRVREITDEQITRIVEVNLLGVMRCARAVLPVMIAQRSGHILTMGSIAGAIAMPRAAVYAATRAGVHRFAEGLRRELRPYGIAVTDVLPGLIDTPMLQGPHGLRIAPASQVASAIVHGLRHPRRSIVVPGWYRIFLIANRLFPGLIDVAADRHERRRSG